MLQKRVAQLQRSVLPRISVEALESRTLLSTAPLPPAATAPSPAPVFQRFETFNELPQQSNQWPGQLLSSSAGPVVFVAGSTTPEPWHMDGYGNAMLTGKVYQLGADGSTTSQDVSISVANYQWMGTGGSKDDTDGNMGPKFPAPGSRSAKPAIQHANPGGTTGSQGGSPTTGQTPPTTTPDPTPATEPSATPTIARPTPPVDPTTTTTTNPNSSPVTPLAMTPTGPSATPPISAAPSPAASSVPIGPNSIAASTYAASNAGINAPAVHEISHPAEHMFNGLGAITGPANFAISIANVANAVAPVQAATGVVPVSTIAGDDTAPATYFVAAAVPSLPARIAYNFVRLDAAAFKDSARAFAEELAALNVVSTNKSHARAWAITAGVLSADVALLIYWHRQGKRRRRQHQEAQPAV